MRTRRKIILVFAALILAIGGWLGYTRAKRAIEEAATNTLTKLTGADVKLKMVGVKLTGTVMLDDIVIRPNRPTPFDDAIFKAKHVQARFGLLSLLRGEPRLKRVAVEDFVINAQYDVNEARWNTDVLQAVKTVGLSNRMPELRLRNGIIKYSKAWGGEVWDVITLPVDATFKAIGKEGDTLSVDMRGVKGASLRGTWRTGSLGRIMLTGQVSTASVPLFENVWDISKIGIVVNYDANTVNIEDCRMRLGDETTLLAKGRIDDYRRRGIFNVEASIKNLHHGPQSVPNTFVYSKSLLENVPGKVCQRFFEDFRPQGVVDIDVKAKGAFNQLAKTTCTGILYCKDVSVVYKDFPYLIDHIKGVIDFNDRMIVLNKLDAKHKDADLVIAGYSKDFLPIWDCNLSVSSPSMPLDDDVYNALDADQKKAWAVISPTGRIGMKYRFIRQPNGTRHMQVTAELQKVDATYKRFEFPLKNLSGTMLIEPDKVTFDNVVSEYEGRKILINGWSKLRGQTWSAESAKDTDSFCLSLDAAGLELEKDVAPLLPARAAQKLGPLKAHGKVRLLAHISNNADEACSLKSVAIECLGDSIDYSGFSYLLRDIRGKLTFVGDEVEFDNMTAAIADIPQTTDTEGKIRVSGKATIGEKGFKEGQFVVSASNLAFDRRLGQLLGGGGRGIYQRISPTGTADFDVNELRIVKDGNDVNSVDVRGTVVFRNCGLTSMLPVTALNGKLNVTAFYKGADGSLKSNANIDVESVRVKDKLLKRLLADVMYDGKAGRLEIRNISSDFYGGKFVGAFALADTNTPSAGYTLNALFEKINVREFMAESATSETPDYVSGLMSGEVDVNSQGDQRRGKVQLSITDMKVEKLSLFGKLLAVLKLTEPQDYAFDKMLVMAYLRNNQVVVEQMDLSGNAFALRGEGSIDLEKNTLNLQFIAAGPRLEKPSMLGSLAEGLWPAIARVTVKGTLKEPLIEQATLPVLKDTLEILGTKKEK